MKNRIAELVQRFRELPVFWRGLVMVIAAGVALVVFGSANRSILKQETPPMAAYQQTDSEPIGGNVEPEAQRVDDGAKETVGNLGISVPTAPPDVRPEHSGGSGTRLAYPSPLIAHTAEIAVATKEFARARASLEEILERHRGYVAKLRMVGQHSGSVLSATLRVPSTELGATVGELKTLGDVEREEQAADEITQQRADLEARLSNAQNTLRRLQQLLKKQTYPDGNVRELQRQIASAGAEVNRLEAERQVSEHRVVFANVRFSLREDLSTPAESFGAQLRGAASAGFGDAAASISTLLVFLIGRGPLLMMWMAILFFPARLVWRKLQPAAMPASSPASGD
jgi:hypothetical protein